jgi:type III secretion protein J
MRRALPAIVALALTGCASEELLHGLDEPQANEVVVALDGVGVPARASRQDGGEGGFTVAVAAGDASRARRLLAERELPRPRAPGFGEVFGKGGLVPTPTEEHALFLHALAGELSRSLEAIDGVVGARVHLGLPQADPLRAGDRPAPRAAVLVRCRPVACPAIHGLEGGIRALVAGAADGLEAGAVSVVIAPAEAPPPPPLPPRRSPLLLALAAGIALSAVALAAVALRARLRPGAERTA